MPTPIAYVRAVRELNQALTDAGHPDLARSEGAWTKSAHDYIGQRSFNGFLEDSLWPVTDRLLHDAFKRGESAEFFIGRLFEEYRRRRPVGREGDG